MRFYEDEDKAESYQFVFNTTENRYVFEKKPNWPWPANQNIGLERPIDLIPGKKYNIRMIVDDTIATIYVDGVALNARAFKRPGEIFSLKSGTLCAALLPDQHRSSASRHDHVLLQFYPFLFLGSLLRFSGSGGRLLLRLLEWSPQ